MKRKITLQGILIIVAAALLGITGTTVGVMALMGQSSAVTVENFVGKTKKVVETWRKDNSIETARVTYVYAYDEEKDKDVVLRQNLKAGTSFTSDSNLKITLSNGVDPDKEFELPDFKEKTEKEVKAWFTDNKFTAVTYAYETDDSITPGNFISMDKEAGSKVKRSDAIKVTICTPLQGEDVLVPSLASMSKDEIASWADQNRINVSFVEISNDTISVGSVISVSVNEGQRLKPGDIVTVEISSGPAKNEDDRETPQYKPEDTTPVQTPENTTSGTPTEPPTQPVVPEPEPTPKPEPEVPTYTLQFDYSSAVQNANSKATVAEKQDVMMKYFTKVEKIPSDLIVFTPTQNGAEPDVIVKTSDDGVVSADNPIIITIVVNE